MEGKMETLNLYAPQFSDEDKAREYLEKLRWANGIECPHCGSIDGHYPLKAKATSKEPVRKGVWKCKQCRKQFSVTVGTIFERSHIPLNRWLSAIYLLCSSKKGMSAHQLHRTLGITYKSAWFMAHRIRYAMTQKPSINKFKTIVEIDETYIGGKARGKRGRGSANKVPVVALVERNGNVISKHVDRVTAKNLKAVLKENVDKNATLMTDDFPSYRYLNFPKHKIIKHSEKEYVQGNIHTNTIEGFFSLLKRGIIGVYHHVGKNHLHRYLSEFDFRYNARKVKDDIRTNVAIINSRGKRLMYRESLNPLN
jgi:transposase-like protein